MGESLDLEQALQNYMVYGSVSQPDEQYVAEIGRMFPVRRLFHVSQVPEGFAPEEVRSAWIGLDLPTRAIIKGNEVPILGTDALLALKSEGRSEAYKWWVNYYETDSEVHKNLTVGLPLFLNPYARRRSLVARISFLGFDKRDGHLVKIKKRT